jgi:DNA-3-methyladenine glycosylase
MPIIPLSYYCNPDLLFLARDLLGKYLFTNFKGTLTGGMIVETEAYRGPEDRASHAYNNRRTERTEIMYGEGGHCYIYFIYGLHALFNIITNTVDIPHAILIRAIEPEFGIEEMVKRRKKLQAYKKLASGPGTLTQALGITLVHNKLPLDRPPIWLEDRNIIIPERAIIVGKRVGVDYAEEDAHLPWRFRIIR